MSSKTTWILLGLVALAAVYLFVLEDFLGVGTTDDRDRRARRLLDLRPAQIELVTVTRRDDVVIELRRADDGWDVTSPVEALADSNAIDGILAQLAVIDRESQPQSTDDPSRFGLDPPAIALVLAGSSSEVRLAIGEETPLGGRRYVRVNEGGVDVVDEAIFGLLNRTVLEFRDRAVFTFDPYDANRAHLRNGDVRVTVNREREDRFTFGDPAFDLADTQRVRDLLYRLSGLDAVGFLPRTDRDPADLGLESPVIEIAVTYPGEPTAERVRIGTASSEHPAALYAFADRFPHEVVLVPDDLLRDIDGDRDSFRAKELIDLAGLQVNALSFGSGSESVRLERDRTGWAIVRPVALDAEDAAVDGLVDALGSVKIRRYVADVLDDAPARGFAPGRRIEIETTGGPVVFRAGGLDDERRFLLVTRTEDAPLLAVDAEVLDLLPETTRDLRSRQMTRVDLWEPLTMTLERDGVKYVVESEDLTFSMREPFEGSLDGRVAQGLDEVLSSLRAARIVEENAGDLSPYGLDSPRIRFHARVRPATRPAYEVALRFGGSDERGDTYAVVEESPIVFTITPDQLAPFTAEWKERRLIDVDPIEITRIRLRGDRSVHLLRRADGWTAREPEGARPVRSAIERAIERLAQFSVDRFVAVDPGAAVTGLETPSRVLQFEVERDATVTAHDISLGNRLDSGAAYAIVGDPATLAILDAATVELLLADFVTQP